jgi:hypothetical protein
MINESFPDNKRYKFQQAVNAVASAAALAAAKEAAAIARNEERVKMSQGVKRMYELMLERGVPAHILSGLDVEGIVLGLATATDPDPVAATGQTMAGPTEEEPEEPPAKKARDNRTGTLTILGREGFQHWKSHDKLAFIAANSDDETSKYVNSDRQWLQRINPIAKCYHHHCGGNYDAFMLRHKCLNIAVLRKNKEGMHGCDQCKAAAP